MKSIKKVFFIVLSFLLLTTIILSSFGCSQKGDAHDFYYFNTEIHVQSEDKKFSNKIIEQIDDILFNIEKNFDHSLEGSLTKTFNNSDVGMVKVNKAFMEILSTSQEIYTFSEKKFNPAILPLVQLWGFGDEYPLSNFNLPTSEQITQLLNSGCLKLEQITGTMPDCHLYKPVKEMQLDLGGIAKGYACDQIAELLIQNGFNNGYVNMGGSSLRLLNMPSLSIKHPRNTGTFIEIDCSAYDNVSVSTSGDYQKYYEIDSKRYSHIIDGNTGFAKTENILSATFIGANSMVADALTTALCVCEYSNSVDSLTPFIQKIIDRYKDCSVYVVTKKDDQTYLLTNRKNGNDFTLLDNSFTIIEI